MALDTQTDDPALRPLTAFNSDSGGALPPLSSPVTQRVSTPAPVEDDPALKPLSAFNYSGSTPYTPAPTWHAADIGHGLSVGWHGGVAAPLAEITGQAEKAQAERESATAAQQAMTPGAEQTWPVWLSEQAAPTAAMVGPSLIPGVGPLLGAGVGAAIGGGSAVSGNKAAIEQTNDVELMNSNPEYAADRHSGLTEEQAKAKLGSSEAFSVGVPSAVLGGIMGGAFGGEAAGLLKMGVGEAETAALGGSFLTRRVSGRVAQGVVGAGRGLAEQGLPSAAQEAVSKHAEAQEGIGQEATASDIISAGVGPGLFGAGLAGGLGAWHGSPVHGKTAPPKGGEANHTGSDTEYRTPAGKVTAPSDLSTPPENRVPIDPTPANKGVGPAEASALNPEAAPLPPAPVTQGVTEPPKPPVEQPPVVQPPPPPISRPPEAPPAADTTSPQGTPQPEARPQPAPAPAPATENVAANVREPDAALAEQHAALIDKANPREAMVYPLGTQPFDLPNKRSFGQTTLDDGRTVQFQKYGTNKLTNADKVKFYEQQGKLNDLLQLGPVTKDEAVARASAGEPGAVVTERTAGGTPVKDAAGTTATVPEQAAALEATKTPGSTVEVRSPEAAVAERQAQVEQERTVQPEVAPVTQEGKPNILPDISPEGQAARDAAVMQDAQQAQTVAQQLRDKEAARQAEEAGITPRQHTAKTAQAKAAADNIAAERIAATHAQTGPYDPTGKEIEARARKMVAAAKEAGVKVPESFAEGGRHSPAMLKLREAIDLFNPKTGPRTERLGRFVDREHMIDNGRADEAFAARRAEGALGLGSPEGAVEVKPKGGAADEEGRSEEREGATHEETAAEHAAGGEEEHAKDEPFTPSETNPIAQKMREDWLAKSPEERAAISRQRNVDDLKDALKKQELVQRGKYSDTEKARAKEKATSIKEQLAAKDVPQAEIQAVVDAVHKPYDAKAVTSARRKLDVERPKVNVGEKLKLKAKGETEAEKFARLEEENRVRFEKEREEYRQSDEYKQGQAEKAERERARGVKDRLSQLNHYALEPSELRKIRDDSTEQPEIREWAREKLAPHEARQARLRAADEKEALASSIKRQEEFLSEHNRKTYAEKWPDKLAEFETKLAKDKAAYADKYEPALADRIEPGAIEPDETDRAINYKTKDGSVKIWSAGQTTAAKAINKYLDLKRYAPELRPMIEHLRDAILKVAGYTEVHYVSHDDLVHALGDSGRVRGLYSPRNDVILLNKDRINADTPLHELFHAATHKAIVENPDLRRMMTKLRDELAANKPEYGPDSLFGHKLDIALKNPEEMLTYLMTEPDIQRTFKGMKISPELAREIGIPKWRKQTAWEGVMSVIRQALGLSPRDTSAIEAAMAISEQTLWRDPRGAGLAMGAAGRGDRAMRMEEASADDPYAHLRDEDLHEALPPEVQVRQMGEDAEDAVKKPSSFWNNDRVQATKSGIGEKFTNAYLKGAMTDVLRIDNEHLFGPKGENNALLRAQEGQLKQGHMIENMIKGHTDLLQRTMDMKRLNPDGLERVFSLLSEAHDFGVHPDVELGAGLNDYIKPNPKTGEYDETTNRDHFEAIHAHERLSDDFNHSMPEEQRLFKDVRDVLMDEGAKSVKANIETFTQGVKINFERDEKLQEALKTPEANRTPADIKRVERYEAVTKVLNGDKLEGDAKEQFANDPHIKGIRDLRGMLKQEGPHFPGTRKGGWVVNAEYHIPEAENALSTKDNTVTFASEKEAFDYQKELVGKSLPSHIETVREPVSSDQKPGQGADTYKVVVQNKHSSTAGSIHEGRTLGDKLRAIPGIKKESVTEPMLRERNDSIDYGIHSGTMRAMEHAVDALTHLSKEEKQAAKEAIEQGSLGLMKGNRMNRGLLKSNRVRGANADPVLALHDYLANSARSQARSKTQPDIDEAFREMREHSRATQDVNTPKRGMIIQEMENRAAAFGKDGFTGQMPPALQGITTLAYLKDMMAPVHYALDLTHQYLYTYPHMAGRHGANVYTTGAKVMSDMGAGGILGKGIKGMFSALKGSDHRPTDLMTYIRGNLEKAGYTADQLRAFDAGRETPHLGSIVTDFSKSFDRTGPLSRANYYMQGIGNEMSHAVDAVNRVNSYMTAYMVERAKMGKAETPEANVAHHAQAVRYAKDTVSQTQGLYSAANRSSFLRNPAVRAAMQFRALPMMIYRLLAKNAYLAVKGETREVKQAAVISLVSTMGSAAVLAGAGAGVPEPIRLAVEMGHALGLTGSWQDYQDGARRYTDAHMGKFGSRLIMDGVLGAAGLNAANRIGLQDLMIKDQALQSPRDFALEMLGSPVGYGVQDMQGFGQLLRGDFKHAVPNLMPIRLFSDVAKAYIENQQGKQAGHGQPDMKPLDPFETFIKAAGGMPTREALYNQEGQLMTEASGEKKAAVQKTAGGNRAAIRAWNTAHPRDLITQAQVLRAKQTNKIETPKQKQVEKDYAVYQ